MEPLCYESSKILFYTRVFGSEDKCPKDFSEVSEKILKKCGGVPLAIITTSSLLANKLGNIKEWNMLYESIGFGLGSNHDMDNMRRILSLSYYDLPSHLKTCLLYLSTFPEDYEIEKNRLIWRWIAEDFVQQEEGSKSLFELGESYFNELLNRSLIQVANTLFDGTPYSCRVHDMVLELICSLSREQSFITIVLGDGKESTPCSHSKVRRLSVRNSTWPSMEISKLRSLSLFSTVVDSLMRSVSSCLLLRVLDLESCNLKDHPNVKFVGNLLHLRFLSLVDTRYAGELPVEIGRLQFLQTLHLTGTKIEELPSSIVGLRQLMSLSVHESTRLPNGLRRLQSLEQLSVARVDSADVAEELGHMKQLRGLIVNLESDNGDGLDKSLCTALVVSIGKLHKIKHLFVDTDGVVADLDGSAVVSLGNLRYMGLKKISMLPAWINPESLGHLSLLHITVAQLRREDILVLGMLPALRDLEVEVSGDRIQKHERSFVVSPGAFPVMVTCELSGNFAMVPSMFPRGAMPRLETLEFRIQLEDFSQGEFTVDDLAMGHLPSLQRVVARLYGEWKVSGEVIRKVEEKLRREAEVHPNNPSIHVM
jgi:disease resistance protein RPM1